MGTRARFEVPVVHRGANLFLRGQPPGGAVIHRFRAGTGAAACLRTGDIAESGTLWSVLPVEKPVGDGGYPRRIRFAPAADTGSGGRRYGFGPSLNRVRIAAESGSRGGDFPLRINGLGFTYTVYK